MIFLRVDRDRLGEIQIYGSKDPLHLIYGRCNCLLYLQDHCLVGTIVADAGYCPINKGSEFQFFT